MSDRPRPGTAGRSRSLFDESGANNVMSVFNMGAMSSAMGAMSGADALLSVGTQGNANNANAKSRDKIKKEEFKTSKIRHDSDGRTALKNEIKGDSLLRILTEKETMTNTEIILLAESGELKGQGMNHLIERGFNWAKCVGMNNFTPLHYACNRGHALVVCELLRSYPPMLHAVNDAGETALHLSVYQGSLLIVEQLIDKGANVNAGKSGFWKSYWGHYLRY